MHKENAFFGKQLVDLPQEPNIDCVIEYAKCCVHKQDQTEAMGSEGEEPHITLDEGWPIEVLGVASSQPGDKPILKEIEGTALKSSSYQASAMSPLTTTDVQERKARLQI